MAKLNYIYRERKGTLVASDNKLLKQKILTQFGVKESDLIRLCRKHGVKSLSVFGSLAHNEFKSGQSDIDLLVEFDSISVDKFFDLQDGLKKLFHYEKIDLVTVASLKNKVIKQEILSSQKEIYAA